MNKVCNTGLCPLVVAAQNGHIDVIEILLLEEWDSEEGAANDVDDPNSRVENHGGDEPTKPDAANQALVAAAQCNQKQVC